MSHRSRRAFLHAAGTGIAFGVMSCNASEQQTQQPKQTASAQGENAAFTLGLASYSTRKFTLDETIAMTKRLGLERLALKSFHLPMDSTEAEIKAAAVKVRDAGIDLYGAGVIYMKTEAEVHQAFDYMAAGDMRVMIGVPSHDLLELVNKKVQEYDIKCAIHNHGPGDEQYPSPTNVYEKVKDLDPRMGLCMDIGHTKRIDEDPSELTEKYADRLHDVHIKDVSANTKEGSTVEIGRGVIDIPKYIDTLIKIGYEGTAAFEFEKDGDDPLPGLAESVGYVRGVLDS